MANNLTLRAAQREFARHHHPDVGGDTEAFIRGMRELELAYGGPSRQGGREVEVVHLGLRYRLCTLRRLIRRAKRHYVQI